MQRKPRKRRVEAEVRALKQGLSSSVSAVVPGGQSAKGLTGFGFWRAAQAAQAARGGGGARADAGVEQLGLGRGTWVANLKGVFKGFEFWRAAQAAQAARRGGGARADAGGAAGRGGRDRAAQHRLARAPDRRGGRGARPAAGLQCRAWRIVWGAACLGSVPSLLTTAPDSPKNDSFSSIN